ADPLPFLGQHAMPTAGGVHQHQFGRVMVALVVGPANDESDRLAIGRNLRIAQADELAEIVQLETPRRLAVLLCWLSIHRGGQEEGEEGQLPGCERLEAVFHRNLSFLRRSGCGSRYSGNWATAMCLPALFRQKEIDAC